MTGQFGDALINDIGENAVAHVDDKAETRARGVGRPSKTEAYRPLVLKLLEEDPAVITLEILRRAKLAGYTGSKTALYALVAQVRPADTHPVIRFEGVDLTPEIWPSDSVVYRRG